MLHLVDATDGITPETGVTGTGYITKNGAAAVATTNSLVEVDAVNMPGFYYIELTAGELDTLGFLGFRFKTAATAEFQDRALVSYNDPYVSAGGFSAGGGEGSVKITKKQLEQLAEFVWLYKIGDKEARELLASAAEDQEFDLSEIKADIALIDIPKLDLTPVLDKLNDIKPAKDYTKVLVDLAKAVSSLEVANVEELNKTVVDFTAKMNTVAGEVQDSTAKMVKSAGGLHTSFDTAVNEIKDGFAQLKTMVDDFNSKMLQMSDMDARFEGMTSIMQKQELSELAIKIDAMTKRLLLALSENKYQLLNQLNQN